MGARWTAPVRRDRLDAAVLTWDMRRRIAVERLPEKRVTVRFDSAAFLRTLKAPEDLLAGDGAPGRSTSASSSRDSRSTSMSTPTWPLFPGSGWARYRSGRRSATARST
jgi:hypothetical protein